jgi:N-acetyl-anhydromuramyl-L-alanine amidase AmpD
VLNVNAQGHVVDSKVVLAVSANIQRGNMAVVSGIIVHQTGGTTATSSLNSYANPKANGAHFLIDKDGTIYQTASIYQQTWHVGSLKARCVAEFRCSVADKTGLKKFNPSAEHKRESAKAVPDRYPSNKDSIGIELVGGLNPGKPDEPAEKRTYETVTTEQNVSLTWLVQGLRDLFSVPPTEVFRHPMVSRKNPTEAASASW